MAERRLYFDVTFSLLSASVDNVNVLMRVVIQHIVGNSNIFLSKNGSKNIITIFTSELACIL